MIIRPDAVVLPGGKMQSGLEICIEDSRIAEIRPWRSAERNEIGLLLTPAFVNAHSHFEYYDLMGRIPDLDYWRWIRELTRIKPSREMETVQQGALDCAFANAATGIAAVGEWSDWPVSAVAMTAARLDGRIFQEIITLNESDSEEEKVAACVVKAMQASRTTNLPVHPTPHATYTTSFSVLQESGCSSQPQSIHACETEHENQFFLHGEGVIADLYHEMGIEFELLGVRALEFLDLAGVVRKGTQLVHCCAVDADDIEIIATRGAAVAHCPRSNRALGCPPAPIAQMIRAGITVGLGTDSAASSGAVDMFAEMRAALATSALVDDPLSAEDVWMMATEDAAASIFLDREWRIEVGESPDLLLLRHHGGLGEQIARGSPNDVVDLIRL